MTRTKKKIIHLIGCNFSTLCGFAIEELDDNGIPNQIICEETFLTMIAKRKRFNTNCHLCQEQVSNVLSQIKRKVCHLPANKN